MITKKDGIEALSKVPLFSGLSQKELGEVYDRARVRHYDAGTRIITEGEAGYAFHLIMTGEATVERGGKSIASLGPGKFFGEMSFIDDSPRSASIVAETPMESLILGGWELKPMVKANPNLAWKLIVHLTGRLREEQSARDAATA